MRMPTVKVCRRTSPWLPFGNRKAAEQGFASAQNSLGFAYEFGQGVPKDFSQAAYWYRKAAEQGKADAQMALGVLYVRGAGLPQDYAEAYFWFDVAAAVTCLPLTRKTMLKTGTKLPPSLPRQSYCRHRSGRGNGLRRTRLSHNDPRVRESRGWRT
jgi:hypothetical protein